MNVIQNNDPQSANVNLPSAMSREQAEVFELLKGFSSEKNKFHKWYEGAIGILTSTSPDKIAQAAHSMRELCDELPKAISVGCCVSGNDDALKLKKN